MLAAAGESGPYVLAAHSYGGLVATLFARTWPTEVAGLVMVDTVTPLLDAFAKIDAAAPLRELPAVVLSSDKTYELPSAPKKTVRHTG